MAEQLDDVLLHFRFAKEDQGLYGDQAYVLTGDHIKNADVDILEAFEDQTGMMMGEWQELLGRGSIKAARAAMWLARLVAGHSDPWKQFKPHVLSAEIIEEQPQVADDELGKGQTAPSVVSTELHLDGSGLEIPESTTTVY